MGTAEENNANAPVAFVLVVCAGLSTGIGAGFVFNKRLVKLASKRFLAGSLGVAAGVMLYVSLVEIFVKSQGAFANHGFSEADAYLYATLSLFGGILFYKGIDFVVHLLEGGPVGDHNVDVDLYDLDGSSSTNSPRAEGATATLKADKQDDSYSEESGLPGAVVAPSGGRDVEKPRAGGAPRHHHHRRSSRESFPHDHDVVVEISSGGSTVHPNPNLQTLQLRMAGRVQQQQQQPSPVGEMTPDSSGRKAAAGEEGFMEEGHKVGADGQLTSSGHPAGSGPTDGAAVAEGDNQKLVRMGLLTAVAIGIHNFPEGLATFVGALSDPSVGLALAVAIAIHNIPEGLCVAIPVYYATGNRWKAFGWALLSGVSEPIGAGLGWLVLKDVMSELVYGILFGMVAGMMVNITIHELIPTAVRYDPADKVTTNSIIAGMAIMALSLTLFLY
eukprot:g16571.t1